MATHDTDASARIRQLLRATSGQMAPRLILLGNDVDALRALLRERDEMADALPPICATCGERNHDGAHSEYDNSWMCARCFERAGRGGRETRMAGETPDNGSAR